jgi:arylformamidase
VRIHDISVPLSEATVPWKGVTVPWASQEFFVDVRRGDPVTGSWWRLNTHAGTHVDTPTHFFPEAADAASMPWAPFLGRCLVVEVGDVGREIERAHLEAIPELRDHRRVLFRTANSRRDLWARDEFIEDYTSLGPDGARYLVELGYLLAGIDYQGMERFDTSDYATHRTLLGSGCMILEGADLRAVPPGTYQLVCLPLRLVEGEGSPVRAILVEGLDEGIDAADPA